MTKTIKTYPELLEAIGQDLKPRLQLTLHITESDSHLEEAIYSALHSGPILELIAQFVGRRLVELSTEEANRKKEQQFDKEKNLKANELIIQRLRSFFDCPNFVQPDLTQDAFYEILTASKLKAYGHQEQSH